SSEACLADRGESGGSRSTAGPEATGVDLAEPRQGDARPLLLGLRDVRPETPPDDADEDADRIAAAHGVRPHGGREPVQRGVLGVPAAPLPHGLPVEFLHPRARPEIFAPDVPEGRSPRSRLLRRNTSGIGAPSFLVFRSVRSFKSFSWGGKSPHRFRRPGGK